MFSNTNSIKNYHFEPYGVKRYTMESIQIAQVGKMKFRNFPVISLRDSKFRYNDGRLGFKQNEENSMFLDIVPFRLPENEEVMRFMQIQCEFDKIIDEEFFVIQMNDGSMKGCVFVDFDSEKTEFMAVKNDEIYFINELNRRFVARKRSLPIDWTFYGLIEFYSKCGILFSIHDLESEAVSVRPDENSFISEIINDYTDMAPGLYMRENIYFAIHRNDRIAGMLKIHDENIEKCDELDELKFQYNLSLRHEHAGDKTEIKTCEVLNTLPLMVRDKSESEFVEHLSKEINFMTVAQVLCQDKYFRENIPNRIHFSEFRSNVSFSDLVWKDEYYLSNSLSFELLNDKNKAVVPKIYDINSKIDDERYILSNCSTFSMDFVEFKRKMFNEDFQIKMYDRYSEIQLLDDDHYYFGSEFDTLRSDKIFVDLIADGENKLILIKAYCNKLFIHSKFQIQSHIPKEKFIPLINLYCLSPFFNYEGNFRMIEDNVAFDFSLGGDLILDEEHRPRLNHGNTLVFCLGKAILIKLGTDFKHFKIKNLLSSPLTAIYHGKMFYLADYLKTSKLEYELSSYLIRSKIDDRLNVMDEKILSKIINDSQIVFDHQFRLKNGKMKQSFIKEMTVMSGSPIPTFKTSFLLRATKFRYGLRYYLSKNVKESLFLVIKTRQFSDVLIISSSPSRSNVEKKHVCEFVRLPKSALSDSSYNINLHFGSKRSDIYKPSDLRSLKLKKYRKNKRYREFKFISGFDHEAYSWNRDFFGIR